MDPHDSRVVELDAQGRLALEALDDIGTPGVLGVQHLDGHISALARGELGGAVPAPVDPAHAADADLTGDAVAAHGARAGGGAGAATREERVALLVELLAGVPPTHDGGDG